MKKLLFGLGLLAATTAWGQHSHNGQPCLYDHALGAHEEAYRQAVEATFREAQLAGRANRHLRTTYTIPVVVHVVWKDSAENLALNKVQQQIDILNEDYQRMNADTSMMRAIFAPVAANPQIQFRLDSVIYVHTDSVFFGGGFFPDINLTNKVKADCSGGDDAWDVRRYLNIWVCNLGSSGVLGFAYPPANLSNWPSGSEAPRLGYEGVVLDYRIVGRSGLYSISGQNIVTQGRSATHEVGHYLGLRHIWGDGTLAIFGIPDCSVDDGVTDTPNQGMGSNFECDTTQNTCDTVQIGDLPDMIENYMDYSTESCMNTFTQGQVDIMRGILSPTGYRHPLSLNTTFVAAPANDKADAAISVAVNTDNTCLLTVSGSNLAAHPSYMIDQCSGTSYTSGDVWFSFVATHTDILLDVPTSLASAGSSNGVVVEVLPSACPNGTTTQRHSCNSSFPSNLTGLTVGNSYYLRVYSQDSLSRQDFTLCLSSNGTLIGVEQFAQLDWRVFPNPSNGQITIQTPENLPLGSRLQVSNALGQVVASYLYNSSAPSLQMELESGFYTVTISNQNGIFSRKVVVNK